ATADFVETCTIKPEKIAHHGPDLFYQHRDQFLPCYAMRQYLFTHVPRCEETVKMRKFPLFIVKTLHGQVALYADAVTQNMEIAVKAVPENAYRSDCVTGVSILPTGEPVFVVSLVRLFERAIQRQ